MYMLLLYMLPYHLIYVELIETYLGYITFIDMYMALLYIFT